MALSNEQHATPYESDLPPRDESISAKYNATWGIAIDDYSGNVHAFAQLLYKSLYQPDFFRTEEARQQYSHPVFIDRLANLSAVIELPVLHPDEEEFIEQVRRIATRGLDIKACLQPDALDTVRALASIGSMAIWTQGDTYGTDEHPGSMSQYKKLALAGIGTLRKEIFDEEVLLLPEDETQKKLSDVLTVISVEDKISDTIAARINELTKDHMVFVVDDRLKNLYELGLKVPTIVPIWVQQDKHGKKVPKELADVDPAFLAESFNAISNLGDLVEKIASLSANSQIPLYFLVDLDGTLTDDTRRAKLQKEAVLAKLSKNNWL